MKALLKSLISTCGYNISRKGFIPDVPVEATDWEQQIIRTCTQYSMTTPVRMWALLKALDHVRNKRIAGDLVECGVWKGGNLILMDRYSEKYALKKQIWAFDTFEGMNEPTQEDVDYLGAPGERWLKSNLKAPVISAYASLDTVKTNLRENACSDKIRFVQGEVEKTLKVKKNLPKSISLLRLDTDWYESTKAELAILYPLLSKGGVLIIDDYGHFKGARKAVDEYFAGSSVWLHYVDYTCRLIIKG